MDDCSPTHAFPNLHLRQPQPFHTVLPSNHCSESGTSSQSSHSLATYQEGFPTLDSHQGEENGLCDINSLDEGMGGHFEGEERASWFCDIQKNDWDENLESPTDDFYAKANFYRGLRGVTSQNSCAQLAYNRKASYATKQATFNSASHAGLDEFGCSSASNENHFQPLNIDTNTWLNITGESRWREELYESITPQKTLNNHPHTQKLDSFSDAFMSHVKRRLPVITSADVQTWDNPIRLTSVDSDSSPSLPSFPSPPTSNLLSPPPTPLPPASYSPSKLDSSSGGGLSAHSSVLHGGEAIGTLQFFPVRPQTLLSQSPSGMMWRFPLLSHCFPHFVREANGSDGNARASISGNAGSNNIVQSLVSSSPHLPVLQSPRALCPSLPSLFHTNPLNPLLSNHQRENDTPQGPAVFRSDSQGSGCPIYTGTTFPSMLQCTGGQKRAHFTPRPQLNPLRRGTGLYASVCHKEAASEEESAGASLCINVGPDFQADIPPCLFDDWAEEWSCDEEESPREQLLWEPWDQLTCGTTAQEQVEKLLQMSNSSCLPGGGTNTELALHCLHRCHGNIMATLEMLLLSRPMPAGDYHYSGADVWTEREKCLFTAAMETHGKDFSLIQTLVKTKTVAQCVEFYYLSKKLEDKQNTCKMEEKSREEEQPNKAAPPGHPITQPTRQENAAFVPSLASFFPCKLCGKMFYKIKSRNAHMKIHRQPQEEWTERKLQQQLLNQALNRASIVQPQTLTFNENNVTNGNSISLINNSVAGNSNLLACSNSTSHVIPSMNARGQSSQEPRESFVPFQTMWGSAGQSSSFYSSSEMKTEKEGGAETVKWK